MGISSPLFIGLDTSPAGATVVTTLTQSFFNSNSQNGFTVAVPQGSEAPAGCADPTTGCDYSSNVLGINDGIYGNGTGNDEAFDLANPITYPCLTEAPGSSSATSGSTLGDCDLPNGVSENGPDERTIVGTASFSSSSVDLHDSAGSFTSSDVGHLVTGTDIASGTTVASYISATDVDLSQDPTGTLSGATVAIGGGNDYQDTTSGGQDDGALRLTTDAQYQVGGVFYSTSFPTAEGLDMQFNSYQWTDSLNADAAGDGIGFVLAATNPSDPQPPSSPGPVGGDLGYSADWLGYNTAKSGQTCSNDVNDVPNSDGSDTGGSGGCYLNYSTHHAYGADDGIPYGYLGFGLDTFGDYANPAFQGQGCQTSGGVTGDDSLGLSMAGASTEYPQTISVKGPGDGTDGYCLLDSTAQNFGGTNGAGDLGYQNSSPATGSGPVSASAVSLSNASATITLSSVTGISDGALVVASNGDIATGTTVSSIDSGTDQVTLSQDPLVSGTANLTFNPAGGTFNTGSTTGVSELSPGSPSDYLDTVSNSFDEGADDDVTRPEATQVEVLLNTGSSPDSMTMTDSSGNPTACTGQSVAAGYWGICILPIDGSEDTDTADPVFMTDKLPSDSYAPSDWLDANGVPKQMVFGWTASTGSAVEIHEVNHLAVQTTNGTLPLLDVSTQDAEGGNSGDPAITGNFVSQPSALYGDNSSPTFTITPTLLYSNEVSNANLGGPETQPITLTETFDSHIDLTNAVVTSAEDAADNSWNCSISGHVLTCTIDPSSEPDHEFNPNGANLTLPLITVRGDTIDASSGTLTTTSEISSADGLPSSTYESGTAQSTVSPTDVVSLSTGSNPTNVGSSVTYTATVTGTGGTAPTGSVTFEDNGTAIVSDSNQTVSGCGTGGIVSLVPGSGSVSTATCTVDYLSTTGSPHPITTPYTGDSNYSMSSSNTYDETVLGVPTDVVSLSAGSNPTNVGSSVTYTATVTGTGGTAPTGHVTFEDSGTAIVSDSNQTVSGCGTSGIVNLVPGSGSVSTATCTVDYLNMTGSPHPITTPYGGDSNYTSVASNTYDESVDSALPTPTDVVSLSSGTNATGTGSSVTYTATVTGTGGTAPTGHVTFEDSGAAIVSDSNQTVSGCGTSGIVNLVPGSGSVSTATCTVDYLSTSGSPHPITTPYGGDGNYNAASSNTYDETVLEVFTLTAVAVPSTTSVGNPVVLIGQGIPAAATGTVTFTSGGTQLCSYNIASASYCTTSTTLAAGSYPVTATYSGDSTYLSETATTSFTLTPLSSTSTPSTSVTIVDLSTTTPYEHSVSLTVPVPGTVTITDQPPASEGSCSVNTDGSINFTPATGYSGVAVCDYTVTLDGVTSPPATVTVTVLPAATSTTLKGNTHKTTAALPVPHGTGPFTYKITKQPPASEGTCSINSAGTITFVRKAGYSGAAVCDYAVVDGAGNVSDTASVTFTGGSDVVAAQGVTPENTPITLQTKVPTGRGPDTYTILTHPPVTDGTGSFASNGAFTFRPADGFTGVVSFTYEVRNGAGQITQGSVTVRVGSSGAVIPGVHTGEAWASPLYWLAMGLVGVLGGSLVLTGRLKRRQT